MVLPSPDLIRFTGGLVAILNPLAAIPTFVSLTSADGGPDRRHVAFTAALTVAVILAGACIFGTGILDSFGTDLDAFRAGGGLVVLLTGLRMALNGGVQSSDFSDAGRNISVGCVPIALPLICGPTAISTVIFQASAGGRGSVLTAIAIATSAVWLTLRLSHVLLGWVGMVGIDVATRLFGLLLSSIGASLVLVGAAHILAR